MFRPSPHDDDIAILDVAEVTETRPQRVDSTILRGETQKPNNRDFRVRLRPRRESQSSCCAAEQCDEFPSPHGFARAEDYIECEKKYNTSDENCAVRYTLYHVRFGSQADHVRFTPESGHCRVLTAK